MSGIDKNLLLDEKIVFRTKKHLIIFFYPLVLTVISIYAYQYMHTNFILARIAWLPALITLLYWCSVGLEYKMSEFMVTNKRVMMKEGFFYRHATEVRMNSISQVNIDQNLIGQLFNFGTVSINTFGSFDAYTVIAQPYLFRQNINQQLDKSVGAGV